MSCASKWCLVLVLRVVLVHSPAANCESNAPSSIAHHEP